MEYTVLGDQANIQIGATGETEILQNVSMIISTLRGSVPLDRGFARSGDALDSPSNKALAAEISALYRAISKYEPRVEITDISFVQDSTGSMEGTVKPKVKFRIKQGVL